MARARKEAAFNKYKIEINISLKIKKALWKLINIKSTKKYHLRMKKDSQDCKLPTPVIIKREPLLTKCS